MQKKLGQFLPTNMGAGRAIRLSTLVSAKDSSVISSDKREELLLLL
jgi:hypothetical protein